MDVKYIPEEELIPDTYYYVHNQQSPLKPHKKPIEIRKYAGYHEWYCNGLGSGGRWFAIAEVPEIDIDDYIIEEE